MPDSEVGHWMDQSCLAWLPGVEEPEHRYVGHVSLPSSMLAAQRLVARDNTNRSTVNHFNGTTLREVQCNNFPLHEVKRNDMVLREVKCNNGVLQLCINGMGINLRDPIFNNTTHC